MTRAHQDSAQRGEHRSWCTELPGAHQRVAKAATTGLLSALVAIAAVGGSMVYTPGALCTKKSLQ